MNGWSRVLTFLMVGVTALNVAGAALYLVLDRVKQSKAQPMLPNGSLFPKFTGVDLKGAAWASRDVPCRVVRITDDNCAYCRLDQPFYDSILSAAADASCEVIEMAPRSGGIAYNPRPGVVQLKYVDTDVGAAIYPFATPQTIVLDRNGSVRMNRRGAFDERSLAGTIALLQSLAAGGAER